MRLILFSLALLAASRVSALPVYPNAIDSCIGSGTCFVGGPVFSWDIDGNAVTAYELSDFREGATPSKLLLEYGLGQASHIDHVGFDYDSYSQLPLETSPITGSLWLEVNQTYDLTQTQHAMTLYFDRANPDKTPSAWPDTTSSPQSAQHLFMTTDGLLAGSGENFVGCCDWPPSPFSPFSASAATDPSLFDSNHNDAISCVAEGCYAGGLLNLLGLSYTQIGDSAQYNFNPTDPRKLLYFTGEGYEGYTHNTYSMSAVPLPAAAWLFGSGLLALLGISAGNQVERRGTTGR